MDQSKIEKIDLSKILPLLNQNIQDVLTNNQLNEPPLNTRYMGGKSLIEVCNAINKDSKEFIPTGIVGSPMKYYISDGRYLYLLYLTYSDEDCAKIDERLKNQEIS